MIMAPASSSCHPADFPPPARRSTWNADRNDIDRVHASNQRMVGGIVDLNLQELSHLSSIAIEDDDSITVCASGHLQDVRRRIFVSFFTWSLDQHFDLPPDQLLIVLLWRSHPELPATRCCGDS